MKKRAGNFINNLSGEMAYKSFCPVPLPIPSIELFVSMYVRKEALLSAQIEGTQCALDDILDPLLD